MRKLILLLALALAALPASGQIGPVQSLSNTEIKKAGDNCSSTTKQIMMDREFGTALACINSVWTDIRDQGFISPVAFGAKPDDDIAQSLVHRVGSHLIWIQLSKENLHAAADHHGVFSIPERIQVFTLPVPKGNSSWRR